MRNKIFFNDNLNYDNKRVLSFRRDKTEEQKRAQKKDKTTLARFMYLYNAERRAMESRKQEYLFPWNLIGASKGLPRAFSPNIFHVHM